MQTLRKGKQIIMNLQNFVKISCSKAGIFSMLKFAGRTPYQALEDIASRDNFTRGDRELINLLLAYFEFPYFAQENNVVRPLDESKGSDHTLSETAKDLIEHIADLRKEGMNP
jgi:hypothetical protein